MRKRTREILALVLLGVLLAVGIGAMAYYMFVGHNWNVAASNIDDSIGQMEGYTVFVYEGTHPKPYEAEAISDAQPMLDDQTRGDHTQTREQFEAQSKIAIADAAASYREKGATVFTIDAGDPHRYSDPMIVGKAGKRIAFMSAGSTLKKSKARKTVKYLRDKGASCIVAITDHAKAIKPLIGEASVVICDDERANLGDGEWRGSTYCVGVPYSGEVGAVVVSPYGVYSSKTITEL